MDFAEADPYTVLGVERGTPLGVVRARYRSIAIAAHPDGSGSGDLERFTEATAAYRIIEARLQALEGLQLDSFNAPVVDIFDDRQVFDRPNRLASLAFLSPALATVVVRIAAHVAGLGWSVWVSVCAVALAVLVCFRWQDRTRRNVVFTLAFSVLEVSAAFSVIALATAVAIRGVGRD